MAIMFRLLMMPGVRKISSTALPPCTGRSSMRCRSTTWPSDAVAVFEQRRIGCHLHALRHIADFQAQREVYGIVYADLDAIAGILLEARHFSGYAILAGQQIRYRVDAGLIRARRGGNARAAVGNANFGAGDGGIR